MKVSPLKLHHERSTCPLYLPFKQLIDQVNLKLLGIGYSLQYFGSNLRLLPFPIHFS